MSENKSPKTLFDKIWNNHVIDNIDESNSLLYIDLHLIHEVTSPQAFESLRLSKRNVRQPEKTFAVPDHNVPTINRDKIEDELSKKQLEALEKNTKDLDKRLYYTFKLKYFVKLIDNLKNYNPNSTLIYFSSSEVYSPLISRKKLKTLDKKCRCWVIYISEQRLHSGTHWSGPASAPRLPRQGTELPLMEKVGCC